MFKTIEKKRNYEREYYSRNRNKLLKKQKEYQKGKKKDRKDYMRTWRKNNPEKVKEYWKRSLENGGKEKKAEYRRKYYQENKKQIIERNKKYAPQRMIWKRKWRLRKKEELAGRKKPKECEICGANGDESKYGLHFDHNHDTREFRGWICGKCNVAIGMVDESVERLLKIKKYLETRNKK